MKKFIDGLEFFSIGYLLFSLGWMVGAVATNAWHVQNSNIATDPPASVAFGPFGIGVLLAIIVKTLDIVYEAGRCSIMEIEEND